MADIIDGYKQFFDIVPQDDFLKFGIDNIITIENTKAYFSWKQLLKRIYSQSTDLFIRSSGRNGNGNSVLACLYMEIFGIKINFDPTNNNKPTSLLQELTGLRKNKTIFNYQVSHVFGNTKNVFCFTAPWNIVFLPKIIDPFTGHEAKGEYVSLFHKMLKKKVYKQFSNEINEYNNEMNKHFKSIDTWISSHVNNSLHKSIKKDFFIIPEYT